MKKSDAVQSIMNHNEESSIKGNKSNSVFPKITCVFLAFVIWLYVMQVDSPEHEETIYAVEVALINTATLEGERNLSVYSGYGNTVDVNVIGQKSLISKISAEDIKITADVSKITHAGSHSIPIDIELPSGLSLGSSSQNTIQVYCDEKASTVVDVRARATSFTIESRLEMGELEPEYDTIIVSGPKEALDKIQYALISLELGNVSSSLNATGELILIDKSGEVIQNPYLRMSRSEISVNIPVYEIRKLPLTVKYKYGFFNDSNVNITISPAELTLRGDPMMLNNLSEIVVTTLDEKRIAGDVTQLVPLVLPDGITSVDGTENVTIQVDHKDTYTSMFNVTDIDAIGARGLKYEIMDSFITITVRGTLEQLDKLRSSDFSAVIDLSGYSENVSGVIREVAQIRIDAADSKNVYEIGEYTVQVKLN